MTRRSRSSTPSPASIKKVALVRLGAVTHSVNMEQRYVPSLLTPYRRAINATAPKQRQHRPTGRLHAVPDRCERCPLGGKNGADRQFHRSAAAHGLAVGPTEGETGVSRTAPIVASFDHAMDKASAETAFSLRRTSDGAVVSGSFSWDANSLVFTPSAPLMNGETYTASVGTGANDAAGFPLEAPKHWQFLPPQPSH